MVKVNLKELEGVKIGDKFMCMDHFKASDLNGEKEIEFIGKGEHSKYGMLFIPCKECHRLKPLPVWP